MAFGATRVDFEQSVSYRKLIPGHRFYSMQGSRCTYHLSGKEECFYEGQDTAFDAESTHLSVGYDGKSIPIRRYETDLAQQNTGVGLSKGQKRDFKREATVSVSNCFKAHPRSVEQIIEGPFSTAEHVIKQPKHHWHKQKHIRAFLSNKSKAICYGIEDVFKRDQTKCKPIIVLIDGDRA